MAAQSVAQAKRYALLIANSNYQALPRLAAPAAEAATLGKALTAAGFDVTYLQDGTFSDLRGRVEPNFLAKLSPGAVVLIYYSGYAIQRDQDNLLLPVDFNPKNTDLNIYQQARSLTGLVQSLEEKRPSLKIVVVEGSLQHQATFTHGSGPGLAIPDLSDTENVLLAFSASPNQAIEKPPAGPVGMFTERLVEALRQPGLALVNVFERVQREVGKSSAGKQQPFFLSKVQEAFYFIAPVVKAEERPIPRVNRVDRQEYAFIPAGTFKMGCVGDDPRCVPHEKPQHQVTISKPFWLGRTEVEIAAYQRFIDANKPRKMPGRGPEWDPRYRITNHPMTRITWEEADAYCKWAGGRLPTEAEWEYAARGGIENESYPLNSENSREKANFMGVKGNDRFDYTAPVRSFDPNPFGLFDLAGNVWEWCGDWFSPDYYSKSPKADPQGPQSGSARVTRGGSWISDPAEHLRISYRNNRFNDRSNAVGFRCVLEDTPQTRKLFADQ
jgi:formylglycine-generating enzyme required for sulfatase activity